MTSVSRLVRTLQHSVLLTSMALVGFAEPNFAQISADGDITIVPETKYDVACDGCPGKKGTRISYTVTRDKNSNPADGVLDFHLRTSDGDEANFKCGIAEKRGKKDENGNYTWTDQNWSFGKGSQLEESNGKKKRYHYVSWYGESNSEGFKAGETWKFTYVYCGSTSKLTNEFYTIFTVNGEQLPAAPDKNGQRDNVPNDPDNPGKDAPGWEGREVVGQNEKVGFTVACLDLSVESLRAGEVATWQINGAHPGSNGVVVWGLFPGSMVVNGAFGYCSSFDISGVRPGPWLLRCLPRLHSKGHVQTNAYQTYSLRPFNRTRWSRSVHQSHMQQLGRRSDPQSGRLSVVSRFLFRVDRCQALVAKDTGDAIGVLCEPGALALDNFQKRPPGDATEAPGCRDRAQTLGNERFDHEIGERPHFRSAEHVVVIELVIAVAEGEQANFIHRLGPVGRLIGINAHGELQRAVGDVGGARFHAHSIKIEDRRNLGVFTEHQVAGMPVTVHGGRRPATESEIKDAIARLTVTQDQGIEQ